MSVTKTSYKWGWITLIVVVGCLFATEVTLADGPPVKWQKAFGEIEDFGSSVEQTSDGGYIIAGYTQSFGAEPDFYLMKTDPNGNSEWQKAFGGSRWDIAHSVQQTADNGYIIAGTSTSFGAGEDDIYLVKTDPNGNLQWERTFGGDDRDLGRSVEQTSDGGYIITGYTESFGAGGWDVYLIRTDPNGNGKWQKTFGGSNTDCGGSVKETSDGGYIIAGWTGHFEVEYLDVYLIKTDANGNGEWQKTFGGEHYDFAESVRQTVDGGYIIAGTSESFGAGDNDVYLIKTDSNGNLEWERTFGGDDYSRGHSVEQTSDGGYIIAGYTQSFGAGGNDAYLIKTDANGNGEWQKTFGGSSSEHDTSAKQTSDDGYIIVGHTHSFGSGKGNVYLVKLCTDGTLAADLNCDSSVDFEDVDILVRQWLLPRSLSYTPADIAGVGDGIVNFLDLCIIAEQWCNEE